MCVFLWLCLCTGARILTKCLLCVCWCVCACVCMYVCMYVYVHVHVCVLPKANPEYVYHLCHAYMLSSTNTFERCLQNICAERKFSGAHAYLCATSLSTTQYYLKHVYVYSESVCLYIIYTLSVNGMRTLIHCLYINCSHQAVHVQEMRH